MKLKRIMSKALAFTVALALLAPTASAPVHVYAASFTDIKGHWAEKYINAAIGKGIVKGYSDGTFKPDKAVTRAEFASMVNKALGNTGTASLSFNDVPSSGWFYSDVSKAVGATYVSGYDDNTFRPNNPITREEAAVMISRIIPTYGASGNLSSFGDYSSISSWALTAMQKTNGKGYIGAYNDGKIHPKDQLTRAQTAKIISDITDKETIEANAPIVKTGGTTLSGKIYPNGVTIHKDLAEGNATIDNCVILGSLSVQGGGVNSIVVSNSRVADCNVAKSSSSVRVVAKGETLIQNTNVSNTAKLEASGLTGGDAGVGFYKINANGSADLTLAGSFPRVNVIGSSANVKLESGTITTLEVGSSAKSSKIIVDSNATVSTANVNCTAAFQGNGTIQRMNANADGITYEKKPSDLNIGSGVTTKPIEANGITFDPADGDKNVAINKKITITFAQAMTKYNGKEITNSDIKDLVNFTKDSKSGTKVSYTATISSSKKVITITPDSNLTSGVKYYITIDQNVLKDEKGNGNSAQSIYFTAGSGTVDGISFNPADGSTGVKTTINPTITFDYAIETYAGKEISSSYLRDNIMFRLNSSSGSNVSFSASINSKSKEITITPNSALSTGQKYYLGFGSSIFRTTSDHKSISSQNVTWTVGTSTVDVSSIDSAISRANTAKSGVATSSDGKDIDTSTYWVTSTVMTTLTNAINTATNAKTTVRTASEASSAASTLDSAVTTFNNAKKYGSKAKVDTSALDKPLSDADAAKSGVVVASKKEEVDSGKPWVTQTDLDTLNSAIASAKDTKSTAQSTDTINTAATKLTAAIDAFKKSIGYGTKETVDKSKLSSAISSANSAKSGVVVNSSSDNVEAGVQWVTSDIMTALTNALATAEAVNAKASATQIEVNDALSALKTASDAFKPSLGTKTTPQ